MRRAIANRRGSTGRLPVLCLLGPVLVVTLAAAAPLHGAEGRAASSPAKQGTGFRRSLRWGVLGMGWMGGWVVVVGVGVGGGWG